MDNGDTIAAISTPIGKGGIGIVRLSGPRALEIGNQLFRPSGQVDLRRVDSHTLHYGFVHDSRTGTDVDEALFTVMKGPETYTREDVVEINCHGGIVPLRETLELALENGARTADPGEFTKRAFLNGRLTLDQARSVNDIVESKTRFSLELSVDRLEGKFSEFLGEVRERLTSLLAEIEVTIDYPDYEESVIGREELARELGEIVEEIDQFLAKSKDGRIVKEGHRVAILGRPNVGKSTLLNRLTREERAIVSETPGTTRDTIEAELEINGIPFLVTDTAGIREAEGEIERKGVERARKAGEESDLSLLLLDSKNGVTDLDLEISREVDREETVLVLNKIDLVDSLSEAEFIDKIGDDWADVVKLSAEKGRGLEELEESVTELVWGGEVRKDDVVLLDVREKRLLREARDGLEEARESVQAGRTIDLVEIDVREARERLGRLLGEDLTEEVLEQVFSSFCVGK